MYLRRQQPALCRSLPRKRSILIARTVQLATGTYVRSESKAAESTGTEERQPQGIFRPATLRDLLDGVVLNTDQLERLVRLHSEEVNAEGLDSDELESESLATITEEDSANQSVANGASTGESGTVEINIDESIEITPELSVGA